MLPLLHMFKVSTVKKLETRFGKAHGMQLRLLLTFEIVFWSFRLHAEARDPQSVRLSAVEKCKGKKENKAFTVSN